MLKVQVNLTDFQKKKITKAYKDGNNINIRIHRDQLDGQDTIMIDQPMMDKIDLIRAKGTARDIKITPDNLREMKSGGFLQFLIPAAIGLATSLIGGSGVKGGSGMKDEGYQIVGKGLKLRTGSGLYLKTGGKLYDLTDTKEGSGFLAGILKVLPMIAKKVLPALGIGALTGVASEGASQVIKKIAGKGGNGLYMQHGGQMYDLTETKEGQGILGNILGVGKIPILGDIPLLGKLF